VEVEKGGGSTKGEKEEKANFWILFSRSQGGFELISNFSEHF
jgi:hypothetical protein